MSVSWIVCDETVIRNGRVATVFIGTSESDCVDWISNHSDQKKVLEGRFTIDSPDSESDDWDAVNVVGLWSDGVWDI